MSIYRSSGQIRSALAVQLADPSFADRPKNICAHIQGKSTKTFRPLASQRINQVPNSILHISASYDELKDICH